MNYFKKLRKAEDKRKIALMERLWIEENEKIHILNYWFYRYFTNEFELYLINFKEKC